MNKELSTHLIFKEKITKTEFVQKLLDTYGSIGTRKTNEPETKAPIYLFYASALDVIDKGLSSHIGTWLDGEGWIFKSAHEKFEGLKEEERKLTEASFRKTRFQLAEGEIFEGYTRDEMWHGWPMPCFTESQALKMAEDMDHEEFDLKRSECGKNFELYSTGLDGMPEIFEPCENAPVKVWGIGAGSWDWYEVKEDTE